MSTTVINNRFEWDSATEATNRLVNGVSFIEAISVLGSANAVYFIRAEESFVVGESYRGTLITVCYAVPFAGRIRVEGAHHATPAEVALCRR